MSQIKAVLCRFKQWCRCGVDVIRLMVTKVAAVPVVSRQRELGWGFIWERTVKSLSSASAGSRQPRRSILWSPFALLLGAATGGAQTAHFNYAQNTVGIGLSTPRSVSVDSSGNVYTADTSNGRILKKTLAADGTYAQSAIVTSLSGPYSIAVDSSGNVYVANTNASQVLKGTLALDTSTQSTIGTGLHSARCGLGSSGNVYIEGSGNGQVLKEAVVSRG